MSDHEASRTLVKSSPELWAECSDAASLARHLGAFGEIRITKLEPETAVAWEGEATRGTVCLEPSGWGTRVVLTARCDEPAQEPPAEPEPEAGSDVVEVPVAARRRLLGRVSLRWPWRARRVPDAAATEFTPDTGPEPAIGVRPATIDALVAALDSLGSAHHRPYSRP